MGLRISKPNGQPLKEGEVIVNLDKKSGKMVLVSWDGIVFKAPEDVEPDLTRYSTIDLTSVPWGGTLDKL